MANGADLEYRRLLRKIDQLKLDSDKVSRLLNQASLEEIKLGVIDTNIKFDDLEKNLQGNDYS
tara:strand:+ start:1498 stop:1686 length:189 start_codon:yes stop_codon:yes gene_type:complete